MEPSVVYSLKKKQSQMESAFFHSLITPYFIYLFFKFDGIVDC